MGKTSMCPPRHQPEPKWLWKDPSVLVKGDLAAEKVESDIFLLPQALAIKLVPRKAFEANTNAMRPRLNSTHVLRTVPKAKQAQNEQFRTVS